MRPVNLQIVNDTLAIAWDDGRESYLALEALWALYVSGGFNENFAEVACA